MRELSVIYDCSWIIQGPAPFRKVSQVVLRYPSSDSPFGFPLFSPSDKFTIQIPLEIECQK